MNVQWIKTWLACLAFYFPLWWLVEFLFFVLPALVAAFFLGYRLTFLQICLWMTLAWSEPANIAAHPRDFHFIHPQTMVTIVIAGTLTVAALARRARGLRRMLLGLGVATLAEAGLAAGRGHRTPFGVGGFAGAFETLIYLAALCLGLWWMISGW